MRTALHRPKSLPCDLDLDPVEVGEVHPVPFPARLQSGRFQFLFGSIGIVTLDGVAVVVQAGALALEERQEEVVTAAQEAVVLATVPDDLQPYLARLLPFFHRYAGGAKAESKASWAAATTSS